MSEFHLGFSIDTSALKAAADEGARAAEAIGKLGDAETKLGRSAQDAAEGQAKVSAATKDAEANAQRFIRALEMEARATKDFERSQDALNKALTDGKVGAQAHAAMMKQLETAYQQAKREAKAFRDGVEDNGITGLTGKLQGAGAAIRQTSGDIAGLSGALSGGVGGLAGGLDSAGSLISSFAGRLGAAGLIVGGVTVGVAALAYAFFQLSKPLAEAADKQAMLQARLTNSLGSVSAAQSAMEALRKQTQQTGLGFDAAADAFARIARNNQAIGLTQQQMLDMVETVQKLGAASGASMAEMQQGMVQFGQALASGRLQGDELRSIMENFPALAKAIADNFEGTDGKMGVTIGTLRRLGSEGELTGRKIADAVLRAQKQAREEYEKLPFTMERANQRLSDSYAQMLGNMGRAFSSSTFVQGVYNFLNWVAKKVGDIFAGIADANNKAERARLDYEIRTGTEMQSDTSVARFGRLPTRQLTPAEIEERRKQREKLNEAKPLTPEEQKREDEKLAFSAAIGSSDTLVSNNLGARGAQRKKDSDTKQLDARLADIDQLIKMGGTKDYSVADLQAERADTIAARENVLKRKVGDEAKKSGGGGAKGPSDLAKLLDDIDDRAMAIAMGGGGGGTDIYGQAMSARQNDLKEKRAADLTKYVDALTRKAVQAANESTVQLNRQTDAQAAMSKTIGASADVIREAEIAQAAADFQYEKFGKITTPATTKAVAEYTEALRRNRTQMDLNKQTQEALDATRRAALAWEQTNADDPREQRRLKFEDGLNEELKNKFGDEAKLNDEQREQRRLFIEGRRSEFLAGEVDVVNKITTAQDKQLKAARDRLRIATLSTEEYEIQLRLINKAAELETAGYKPGTDGEFERIMAREGTNAREEQRIGRETDNRRKFVTQWEKSAREIEGLFSNSFDTIFTEGVSKAGSIFAKGFGQIIKNLSAQMIYELAYKPLAEMASNFVKQFGQSVSNMLFGPAPATPSAKGSYFAGGRSDFAPFAMGGAFTNTIVDQPTMFAFANGGALGVMGEAGPEAIMPLKRDGSGRLGVTAQGAGGDVQVVVNDMRSSAGSEPVETKSSRGPDGRRIISVMIRDEMRRQLRSGDMDRDMATNYGNTRVLTRK